MKPKLFINMVMLLQELYSVRNPILYLELPERDYSIFFSSNRVLLDTRTILRRSRPEKMSIILHLKQAEIEHKINLNPVPSGELPEKNILLKPANPYIAAIELRVDKEYFTHEVLVSRDYDLSSRYEKLHELVSNYCHRYNIPLLVSKDTEELIRQCIELIHRSKPKAHTAQPLEIVTEPTIFDPKNACERLASLAPKIREECLFNILSLNNWFEGWSMEEDDNKDYSRAMYFAKKILDHDYSDEIKTIYRSVMVRNIPSSTKKLVLTSPKRFQSWTTSFEKAREIAESNISTISTMNGKFVIFQAETKNVDIVFSVRDLDAFLVELLDDPQRYIGEDIMRRHRIITAIHDLSGIISKMMWQDEVVIKSPVNRKIPITKFTVL